jgi:hypothetical protein
MFIIFEVLLPIALVFAVGMFAGFQLGRKHG